MLAAEVKNVDLGHRSIKILYMVYLQRRDGTSSRPTVVDTANRRPAVWSVPECSCIGPRLRERDGGSGIRLPFRTM